MATVVNPKSGVFFMVSKKRIVVYSIFNTVNNRVYVGSTINFYGRIRNHLSCLINKKHANQKLQEDFDVFGLESFMFLVIKEYIKGTSRNVVFKDEAEYIKNNDCFYNIASNGNYFLNKYLCDGVLSKFNLENNNNNLIIECLSNSDSYKEASIKLGISERTLYRKINILKSNNDTMTATP